MAVSRDTLHHNVQGCVHVCIFRHKHKYTSTCTDYAQGYLQLEDTYIKLSCYNTTSEIKNYSVRPQGVLKRITLYMFAQKEPVIFKVKKDAVRQRRKKKLERNTANNINKSMGTKFTWDRVGSFHKIGNPCWLDVRITTLHFLLHFFSLLSVDDFGILFRSCDMNGR